jgi:predicted DCC family thiol-disulfide oxidoreductase YuxK
MKVVLFDGVCNLCNSSVDWIVRHDRKAVFHFASLQSEYGRKVLAEHGLAADYTDSVLLLDEGQLYERSTAALRVLKHLGGAWSLLYGFVLIPSVLRNPVYNFVARNRYKWFGKRDTCRIAEPELKSRFL